MNEREAMAILVSAQKIGYALRRHALETAGSAIMVDEHMRTNIAGVFAAGDVTGEPYQIARAIGQGNVAALAIASYFAELEKE